MSARLYLLPLAPLNSGSVLRSPLCRKDDMAEVDAAFHRLQPVAFLQPLGRETLFGRHGGELPLRQRAAALGRAHVGPEHAAALDQRIALQFDALAEAALATARTARRCTGRSRRTSSRGRGSAARSPRCGRTRARRRGARRTRRSGRAGPCCRETPPGARTAASRAPAGSQFSGNSSASSAGSQ